ncbi:hypothetical protein VP141O351_P0096 [Vibrio phage 141O35-1]|nr:hypothetical protein VP141O351_P0096 [Vibrio phage 141O35-1]CAH9016487.1 hypothetical protein VP141E351_P0096 [Vibrio phage 141E35-1]
MRELKVIFVNILKDGRGSAKVGVFIDDNDEPEETQNINFSYLGGNVFDEVIENSTL